MRTLDRRDFIKLGGAAATATALVALNPGVAFMATIPQNERNAAIDGLLQLVHEDALEGGRFLNYLNVAFPGFDWIGILRTRAAIWAPFIADGLSISAWCDDVARYAAVFAGQ